MPVRDRLQAFGFSSLESGICGGSQPAEFGVLLGRGIASVRRTVPAKRVHSTIPRRVTRE